jgi:hypothetical protein
VEASKLLAWIGPERRQKVLDLLTFPDRRARIERRRKFLNFLAFPDRRGLTKPNGGHPVPAPGDEAERAAIEQSSRAFRLPHFMKPRGTRRDS